MSVLVVTGVAREAKIAAGPGVETLCSGGSPGRLRTLLARHDPIETTAVISFGIAGGLNPALMPGHVVLADAVISREGRWQADAVLTGDLMQALQDTAGLSVLLASLAGVDVALTDVRAKAMAREGTGAAAVDMETHLAAAYAARRNLPFAAVRVVCDPANRGLPPLVNDALRPDGRVSLGGVWRSLRRQPGQIGDLIRLARDARIAFRALELAGAGIRAAAGRN